MSSPTQWLTDDVSRYSGSPPLESMVEPNAVRSGHEEVLMNTGANALNADDDGLPMELDQETGPGDAAFGSIRTDVYQRLAQIQENITQLHQTLQNHQHHTDTRLAALMDSLQELANSQAEPLDDPRRAGPRRSREKGKDSRANYLRRCIRKHVGLTFGFRGTDSLPSAPSDQDIRSALALIDRGGRMQKPYRYDWRSPPTALYNVCVENAFSADFWASARGGQYDLTLIPEDYQSREPFIDAYRRYMIYLKKCWSEQQQAPSAGQKAAKAKHYSRNSRIGTPLPSGSQGVQTGGGLHPHVPDACGAPPSEHSTCGYTDAWSAEFAVCLGPESLVELPPPADGTRSAAAPACGFSHELEHISATSGGRLATSTAFGGTSTHTTLRTIVLLDMMVR
ncbi:hypothetical protein C8T65DRAFT_744428 [Cerioporus squamosus]|nr:hypothetical protein C8T65DRAFT_744428 [Cerioporus squamosus]